MTFQLYWGDLHSHCSISYGHGTVAQALLRARGQLDFCSITGHAFWPDMPTDRSVYGEIIDYHRIGFARLARNWQPLLEALDTGNAAGEFVTFPSYEWHSLKYGDHNIYAPAASLALENARDLPTLRSQAEQSGAIAVPHHIGYASGYRGIDWDHFREDVSPFVEIFSLHGCSLAEDAPYPMLHDMGPRDAGSSAEEGWSRGLRFGIVGGTDHHGAYPGSHGDGRMGVFAESLTRESLWQAFRERRVFAATGDRIDARLFVNDSWMGSHVHAPHKRSIRVSVHGSDSLQLVELLKNGRVLGRFFPTGSSTDEASPTGVHVSPAQENSRSNSLWRLSNGSTDEASPTGVHVSPVQKYSQSNRLWRLSNGSTDEASPTGVHVSPAQKYSRTNRLWRLRVTWGWGRKDKVVRWQARLSLSAGLIRKIETCFSGQPIVAPQDQTGDAEIPDDEDLPHVLTECSGTSCVWSSLTKGNPTMRHQTTQSISLEVEAPTSATLALEINGQRYEHPLDELVYAGRSHYLHGWLSEAVRIGPLVPLNQCQLQSEIQDQPELEVDIYRLQVAQHNGQWAWSSPIWVSR